eukprot:TRINITY_DN2362_c0_g2_i1.p2 TRINITY_DN2362_c0_g2~~TRINITY_DN2362_c0_g2_i1.p2  ORF type:complete len:660 (-),score=62.81 TRINITY_DN2362_c0_g2_i1:3127-5106(-)
MANKVLRLLRHDEKILELHQGLTARRIPHEFYALPELVCEKQQEQQLKEINEKFFKEGKWERVGDLFKGSDKTTEKDANKKQIFTKKTFYLGKDILYYFSKDSIFVAVLTNKLEIQEVNAIPLQHVKIWGDKDPKDNRPLIKIDSPSSQLLVLKANSQTDYIMWYNSIYFAAMHAHTKRKLEDFDKIITKIEQDTSRMDKKDIASFFYGVEGLLKVDETRKVLFESFSQHKPEYKYLGEMYELIKEYKQYSAYRKISEALIKAKRIYNMLTDFTLNQEATEEAKDTQDTRNEIMKDMENAFIEIDAKEAISEIAPEALIASINTSLQQANLHSTIFNELEHNLVGKFKALYEETRAEQSAGYDSLRLLKLPVNRLKKSLQWSAPCFLENLVKTQQLMEGRMNGRALKPSNSVQFIIDEEMPRFSMPAMQRRATVDITKLKRQDNIITKDNNGWVLMQQLNQTYFIQSKVSGQYYSEGNYSRTQQFYDILGHSFINLLACSTYFDYFGPWVLFNDIQYLFHFEVLCIALVHYCINLLLNNFHKFWTFIINVFACFFQRVMLARSYLWNLYYFSIWCQGHRACFVFRFVGVKEKLSSAQEYQQFVHGLVHLHVVLAKISRTCSYFLYEQPLFNAFISPDCSFIYRIEYLLLSMRILQFSLS